METETEKYISGGLLCLAKGKGTTPVSSQLYASYLPKSVNRLKAYTVLGQNKRSFA
ncbi:hypothetical protein [Bacteroides reticulotermitis]|uniref:hypothetical protein n=1 Tax=Bacteroides reticulotermitis TaxID=1133319 RepID=UPI0004AFDD57|nr:hypothetical protein [Bacteroides reticulotermitis]